MLCAMPFKSFIAAMSGLVVLMTSLFVSGCSVVGVRTTEEASFTVVERNDDYEIRRYDSVMAVETYVEAKDFHDATDVAFRRLFNYITGDNQGSDDIAMTAPVIATPSAGKTIAMTSPVVAAPTSNESGWRLQFVLPKAMTRELAPIPTNPDVKLLELPEKLVAVKRYSGLWDDQRFEDNKASLESWLSEKGYHSISNPYYAGYDPPWTLPFMRRNEVLVEVAK